MKPHPLDPVSLFAGVGSALVALFALLDAGDWLDVRGHWVWPVLLIGLGVGGLLAALRPERNDSAEP